MSINEATNPFNPTFGSQPPVLVGRSDLVREFGLSLDEGSGSPGRKVLYTGLRGIGKTVLLNAVEDEAKSRGWVVISETASEGLLSRIIEVRLPELMKLVGTAPAGRKSTGATLPFGLGGMTWQPPADTGDVPDLRQRLFQLEALLSAKGTGLLITIDELHRNPRPDLERLFTELQHAIREGRQIAFAAAGLPDGIEKLLADKTQAITFLQRADRHHLGPIEDMELVKGGLLEPMTDTGRSISNDGLTAAAAATQGYPFLIQLVGYHVWRQHQHVKNISMQDVEQGVLDAHSRLGTLVLEPSLKDLSHLDRLFLGAMSEDNGPSKVADIAKRLSADAKKVSLYRQRLLSAELIEATSRGELDFAIPFLREYLRRSPR